MRLADDANEIEARLSFLYSRAGSGRLARVGAPATGRPRLAHAEPGHARQSAAVRGRANGAPPKGGTIVTRASLSGRVAVPALVFLPTAAARPRRRTRPASAAAGRAVHLPVAVVLGCGPAIPELKALARGRSDLTVTVVHVPTGTLAGRPARTRP